MKANKIEVSLSCDNCGRREPIKYELMRTESYECVCECGQSTIYEISTEIKVKVIDTRKGEINWAMLPKGEAPGDTFTLSGN